jgi:hypothetical protein
MALFIGDLIPKQAQVRTSAVRKGFISGVENIKWPREELGEVGKGSAA